MIILEIKRLELISYGKLNNKRIDLDKGLNVIYGENESGKSTIRNFIFDMLYGGTVPGSNRAFYTKEFEKFKPWSSGRFEGNMIIQDEEKDFLFHRNFLKNNESFSIRDLSDGSTSKKRFFVDDSRKVQVLGDEFFGITETTLRDLFLISEKPQMSENLTDDLKDRILNQFNTNSENISIKDVTERIENKTNTRDIRREIRNLREELEEINGEINQDFSLNKKDNKYDSLSEIENRIDYLEKEEENYKSRINYLLDDNDLKDNLLNEKLEEENDLIDKIDYIENQKRFPILNIVFIIASILVYVFTKNLIYTSIVLIIMIVYTFLYNKNVSKNRESLKELYHRLDTIRMEMNKSNETNLNLNEDMKYLGNVREELTNLKVLKERKAEEIRRKKEKENNLNKLRERRDKLKTELEEKVFKNEMGIKAIEIINDLSSNSFNKIARSIIDDSSYFLENITNGKYTKLYINESGDISVYDSYLSRVIDIDDLSTGTIGQIYLAYRLGVIETSKVDFPIIIDEGLSFYDEDRQKATIKILEQISEKHQIIFFTNNFRDFLDFKENVSGNFIRL